MRALLRPRRAAATKRRLRCAGKRVGRSVEAWAAARGARTVGSAEVGQAPADSISWRSSSLSRGDFTARIISLTPLYFIVVSADAENHELARPL